VAKIFINYRRDDCIATAGRLHDRLVQSIGRKNLFMDVDHIPAGVDFRAHLEAQIAACDILLVLIGPQWLTAAHAKGGRRLDDASDYVRVEIAAALARGVRVIPVLVDGARMPGADDLPDPLQTLALRNAVEVRNTQFGSDVQRLLEKITEAHGASAWWAAAGRPALVLAICSALLIAGWAIWRQDAPTQPGLDAGTQRDEQLSTATVLPPPTDRSKQLSRVRLRQAVVIRASATNWQWIEKDPRDNREVTFRFRQQSESPDELVLYDASRDMYARLNFNDGRAYWRIGQQGPWNWNYDILETE
jgi:hypothetical protein